MINKIFNSSIVGNLQSVNHHVVFHKQAENAVLQAIRDSSEVMATNPHQAYFHPPQDAHTEAHTQSLALGIVVTQSILFQSLVHIFPEESVQSFQVSCFR
ncbi:TPA: hypothetical protein DEG21_02765 [Patescibacteria group bacterium]|nr:hypothetical protein [Candidatus Gracilibacteria bacterium]HBY74794.1 hypothetical protein [Candidatus Gracilibacteria bacterium]